MPPPAVAAVRHSKPKRRRVKRESTRASKKDREPRSGSEDDSDSDSLDVNDLRRARTEYYSQTPEQRRARERTEAVRGVPRPAKPRGIRDGKTERKSRTVEESSRRPRKHLRERTKTKRRDEPRDTESENDFVYPVHPARTTDAAKSTQGIPISAREAKNEHEYVYKAPSRPPAAQQRSSSSALRPKPVKARSVTGSQRRVTHPRSSPRTNPLLQALGLQQPPAQASSTRSFSRSTATVARSKSSRRASVDRRAPTPAPERDSKERASKSTPNLPRRRVITSTVYT